VNDPVAPADAVAMVVIVGDMIVEATIVAALLPHEVDTAVDPTPTVTVLLLVILLPIGNIHLCLDEMIRILLALLPDGRNMFPRDDRVPGMKTAPRGGRPLMALPREGRVKEMNIGVIGDPFSSLGQTSKDCQLCIV
jgi:hypothetical protein